MSRRRYKKQPLRGEEISLRGEVGYIVRRAAEHDARLVTFGSLVLFSAETGDAWMLDPEDSLALCLARDGEPQPVGITATEESFAVEWDSAYQINGDLFGVIDKSGRIRTIMDYPTRAILNAIQQADRNAG